MFKRTLMAALVTVFVAAFAAGAAFAGEATGNFGTDHGKNNKQTPIGQPADTDPPHAASICSFSGQNPERFLPETIVDHQTNVNVHGCALGRNPAMLQSISQAIGGKDS